MYEPGNYRQMKNLRDHIDWSRESLRHARKMYRETWDTYVGDRATESSTQPQTFLLLTKMAFGILRRHLVSSDVRVLTATADPKLMPLAETLRLAMDDELRELDLASHVWDWVNGALAKMGILWCGLDYFQYDDDGELGESARPAVKFVDFTTWFHDMWTRRVPDGYFMGHRMRIHYDEALSNPIYNRDVIEKLRDSAESRWRNDDDSMDELMQDRITQSDASQYIEFDTVYLPRYRTIVSIPCEGGADMMVHDPIEWDGPDHGPYHLLAYDKIPNNALPSPPSDSMVYMHKLANSLWRKIAEDSANAKQVLTYLPGSDKDVKRLVDARNLQTVQVANPNAVSKMEFNGVDSQTMGAYLAVQREYSWANGGLETLGGLGIQSNTATQEQQLLMSAGGLVEDMKMTTLKALTKLVRHIAHYKWRDELWQHDHSRHVPGLGRVPINFSAADRTVSLDKFRIDVSPYATGPTNPAAKLQAMNTLMLQILPGLLQLAQSGAIDLTRTIKKYAMLLDISEYVEDVLNVVDTTQMPGPENTPNTFQDQGPKRYIRESVSGQSQGARDQQLMERFQKQDVA